MASGLVAQLSPLLVSPRAGRGGRGKALALGLRARLRAHRVGRRDPSRIDRSSRAFRYLGAEFRLPHARSIAGGSSS